MKKVHLCSFASPDLDLSVKRFVEQANKLKFYDKIKIYGKNDLSEKILNQIKTFKYPIKYQRLYGYACWKPFIIKDYIKKIPEGEIIQYSDIGCHLNVEGLKRLNEYIEMCEKKNVLTFQYKLPEWKDISDFKFQQYFEYEWTKGDTWRYLDIKNNSDILKTEQIWSGTIFFKNNSFSKKIIDNWLNASSQNNLIDDCPSITENHEDFKEHRHDQSIFSIICKKNNIFSISASECEWAEKNNQRTWDHLKKFPIQAKRDKQFNFLKRFIHRQIKTFKRYF